MSRGINAEELMRRKKELKSDVNEFLKDKVSIINQELKEIQKITSIHCESEDTYLSLAELKVCDRNTVSFILYEE